AAHRSGMVLPAVLRDPARGPEQARWRAADVRLDRGAVHPAMARPLAGAQRALPAGLPAVLLAAAGRLHRARLDLREPAGWLVPARRPDRDDLLLRPFPGHPAAVEQAGTAAAAAGQHRRAGVARRRTRSRRCPRDGETLMRQPIMT